MIACLQSLTYLLDEHIQEGEINSICGIIREELDSKFDALKKELAKTFESKIKKVSEDVTNLMSENNTLKKVVLQQQTFLESTRREHTKENIFVSANTVWLEIFFFLIYCLLN